MKVKDEYPIMIKATGNTGMDQMNWENILRNLLRQGNQYQICYQYNDQVYMMTISDSGKIITPIEFE